MGRPCWMTWHVIPIQQSLQFWKYWNFFNHSYFAKSMTRKPKIGNLTNVTELYPFLESEKWICYLGDFVVT